MRLHEIENLALNVVDRVNAKQPNEDSRVELKADWPDPYKAARRIAGHANAARGEPVLWLIGVDEKTGVKGASIVDLASWFPQVESRFEGLAPTLTPVNIPVDSTTIVALLFETDRAPFVIKVEGSDRLEVPWRGSTSIRSAKRSELLRLLSPLQILPLVEVVACDLRVSTWKAAEGSEYLKWEAAISLFLTQPTGQESVIPSHRCNIVYAIPDYETWTQTGSIAFFGMGANNINATEHFMSIRGSGSFEIRHTMSFGLDNAMHKLQDDGLFGRDAVLTLDLWHTEADRPISLKVEAQRESNVGADERRWRKGWHAFLTHPQR